MRCGADDRRWSGSNPCGGGGGCSSEMWAKLGNIEEWALSRDRVEAPRTAAGGQEGASPKLLRSWQSRLGLRTSARRARIFARGRRMGEGPKTAHAFLRDMQNSARLGLRTALQRPPERPPPEPARSRPLPPPERVPKAAPNERRHAATRPLLGLRRAKRVLWRCSWGLYQKRCRRGEALACVASPADLPRPIMAEKMELPDNSRKPAFPRVEEVTAKDSARSQSCSKGFPPKTPAIRMRSNSANADRCGPNLANIQPHVATLAILSGNLANVGQHRPSLTRLGQILAKPRPDVARV